MFIADKDRELILIGAVEEGGNGTIIVSICSYDGGEPKLSLTRRWVTTNSKNETQTRFAPIGRMNEEEVCSVIELLQAGPSCREWFMKAKRMMRKEKKEASICVVAEPASVKSKKVKVTVKK